ncbi:unnamed protein product [Heligmosomoides polygyrus]|uniref:Uncharacterized protein n=1 Tax=Heligmosomoides polygyrus TaxID=6339 RepID=A0A3P7XX52_HELPZ|nr:unnamed protein product [Heligmosomoides polygyrus]
MEYDRTKILIPGSMFVPRDLCPQLIALEEGRTMRKYVSKRTTEALKNVFSDTLRPLGEQQLTMLYQPAEIGSRRQRTALANNNGTGP